MHSKYMGCDAVSTFELGRRTSGYHPRHGADCNNDRCYNHNGVVNECDQHKWGRERR